MCIRDRPDSARPPAVWDATTRSLTWNLDAVPLTGVTLQFRVIPQIAGQRPTNVSAGVTYRAVSYTHLDVYKRQTFDSSTLNWKGEDLAPYKQGYEVKGKDAGSDDGYIQLRELTRALDAPVSALSLIHI